MGAVSEEHIRLDLPLPCRTLNPNLSAVYPYAKQEELARFAKKVVVTEGCWEWNASLVRGYAQFWYKGKNRKGHRVSYEWAHGPIPEELEIDHLCKNRQCVNPLHLEAVPSAVNNERSTSPSANNMRKTHCARGHKFDANLAGYPTDAKRGRNGMRRCRICHIEYMRKRYAEHGDEHKVGSTERHAAATRKRTQPESKDPLGGQGEGQGRSEGGGETPGL